MQQWMIIWKTINLFNRKIDLLILVNYELDGINICYIYSFTQTNPTPFIYRLFVLILSLKEVSLHFLKKCIRPVFIQHLRSPHNRNQIFCIAQVDDIVCPARFHPYALDMVAGYFVFFDLVVFEVSHLDQAMAFYYDEDLVLAVVPVSARKSIFCFLSCLIASHLAFIIQSRPCSIIIRTSG